MERRLDRNDFKRLITDRFRTQAELARMLGWSRQRLNNLTCGRKTPDLSDALAIAEKLNMSVDELTVFFM